MKITKVKNVKTPTRGTSKSAGLDFYVPNGRQPYHKSTSLIVYPRQSVNIPSGIIADVPPGFALIAFNKSGVALKKGLQVGACVVDEDYQGEIHLHVTNIGSTEVRIDAGEKLVQFLLIPVSYAGIEVVESKEMLFGHVSERAEGGFGSTGS